MVKYVAFHKRFGAFTMRSFLSKVMILAAALALVPATAKADLPGTVDPSCVVMSTYIGITPFQACWGAYPGNDPSYVPDIVALLNGYTGGPWTWVGKTNVGETSTWASSVPGVVVGTITFASPITTPFAMTFKAGDQFSIYYYANAGGSMSSVDFNTYGVNVLNPGSNVNALSHTSLYVGTNVVPEPATVLLLATGLLGLGFVEARRRKRA
jgi:hypothetical protein